MNLFLHGKRLVFLGVLLSTSFSFCIAQTTIAIQDFETVPATPTLTYTNTNGAISTGTNPAGGVPANANLFSGGARGWQANNTTSTVTFANQSLSGYSSSFVDLRLAGMSVNGTNGIDAADIVTVAISIDGGTTYSDELTVAGAAANQRWDFTATGTATITYDGNNTPTPFTSATGAGGISTITINIPDGTAQVRVRVTMLNNDANERWVMDDVRIRGTLTSCVSSAIISSFTPTSGSAGTIVTINGTGFTGITDVKFGGISATTFTVVSSTIITAEVPATANTGKISIVDASTCVAQSSTDFTFLSQNANCGIGSFGTDLIISEIFDSQVGSIGYIEIFNPTSGAINLNGYYLRINTGAITNLANFASFSLASGAVAVIRIGDPSVSGSSLCSAALTETFNAAPGFNASDEIALMKGTSGSGVVLDVVNTPAAVGYSQLRNAGAITPRTTFQSSEWTNADPETCGHLGTPPSALSSTNVTITNQPADVNCTAVTFSVTASAVPGTINYTWYYQSPGSAAWALVSSLNGTNGLTVTGSGTLSITITGNTAILKDYQFYCEIGSGGSPQCIKYTNAVQYTYNSLAYYRTVASGQWTNPAIWEMSTTEGGSYSAACQYPVAANSDKVNILNTHTVTLDVVDVNIDWVNVNAGGALTIGTTSLLSFNNGNSGGADFEVNGTLTDNGSNTNGVDFITSSGAAWNLGANATIIRTNTSSSSTYRDNYQNGMSNIPATANWIIRGSSSVNVSFTTTATSAAGQSFPSSTFYPNLTFESSGGLWNAPPASTSSRFTGSSDFATVKGNLDIGGTALGTVTVYNENINATSLQILGNLTVRAGNTLTNNGNSSGTGFEVKGNVTVNGVLTVNGSGSTGLLTLSGAGAQTVSGAGTINLQNLTINNSSSGVGSGVTLSRTLSMPGILTLTDGTLNTTTVNLFIMTAAATNPGGGSFASFVNGPMKKIGDAAFTFPVGKLVGGTEYHFRPILISDPALITEEFTAEFQRANPILQGGLNPDAVTDGLAHISRCEYWDLVRNVGSTDVNVTLSWSNNPLGRSICNVADPATFPYVDDLPSLVVVPFESSLWGDQAAARYGQTSTSGSITPTSPFLGYITWNGPGNIGAYQKFSLGTTDYNFNPLPFNLTLFKATGKQKQVDIDWTVSNNHQVLQYTIERSKDGLKFQPIATIPAKAIAALASYKETDAMPFNGWNYYRLRAITIDGTTNVSFTEKVWMGGRTTITISPVPAKDVLKIYIPDAENITAIDLLNPVGQRLMNITAIRTLQQLNISNLAPGIYYLRFTGKTGVEVKTFVKQ